MERELQRHDWGVMKVVAIVGMSGSGKSEVARSFEEKGFERIRFGDLTDREVLRRGLELNEENERYVRERLREEHGMAAYAKLNLPAIDAALQRSNVVVDGLYSWEEYKLLKEHYGEDFLVVTVYSSPGARQERLSQRPIRPLTVAESVSRDFAEIENLGKGGPIAMADFTLINESSLERLREETERLIAALAS
ncbi:AAA family ATPase [Dehalococcoidia bacterium]|nr:AAA family ATPase [Dehalococcoidia bacterium]MCL0079893.1 AAA family ATPase [Dehalococcoidia bacterium]